MIMNSPTPTLRPHFDQRSLLAEVARHDAATPALEQLCDAVNEMKLQATAQLHNHPEALAQIDDQRFTNTVHQSELGQQLTNTFSAAAMMQLHPGKKKDDLSEEQQHYVQNTAQLNTTAVALLANANQLSAQTVSGLFRNTSLVVDKLMNTLNTASRNNLNNSMRLQAQNNFQDPNSPSAVLSAMQNGDGSFLVNVLRDSAAAAVVETNLETAEEQQREFNVQTQEEHAENDQAENLVSAENLEAENTHTAQHHTTPELKPSAGSAHKDDDELNKTQSSTQSNETDNATSTHHLHDAIQPLEELAEKGVEHAALKEVGKLAAHIAVGS